MPAQDQAFALVTRGFAASFAGQPLVEPEVRWWTTPCPGTKLSAVIWGPQCYSGLYRSETADVAWRGSFGSSAYSHELMHYFLERYQGDSDIGHSKDEYWSVVRAVDLTLQDQGM